MTAIAAAGEPLLSVQSIRVQFGPLTAVRDVSFDLHAGDLLGLIGPNGAGKTTLLRALAGLQPATRGRATIFGSVLDPSDLSVMRQLGFTPDTPSFYEELTVRKFLRFVARGYDLTPAETEERIDFWLEKVWLTEKANQKIKALSRGMRQRIGLARTLLPNPHVILLDEPAAGLDPAGRVQFRQLLCSLREQGKALIVSSHILADMEEYCSHIGIMAQGAMVQFGTVAHIAGHAEGRSRYTLLLAGHANGLAKLLETTEGVDHVEIDDDRVTLEYLSRREDAAALLVRLVAHGVPVASFAAHAPGLEEAYLRAGIGQVD